MVKPSAFSVEIDKAHPIILEPLLEIPAYEKELFDNETVLNSIRQGLKALKGGELRGFRIF